MFRQVLQRVRRGAAPDAAQAGLEGQDVEVTLYCSDCRLRGRLRLASGRLTDLVAAAPSLDLCDVSLTVLSDGRLMEMAELTVLREELVAIEVAGAQGNPERRRRTVPHGVSMLAGPYRIRGFAHALPGAEPLTFLQRRGPIVPLTGAVVDYEVGAGSVEDRPEGLIVNLDLVDHLQDADRPGQGDSGATSPAF